MNNKEKGNAGEYPASKYLVQNGYEILERNIRFSRLC